MACCSSIVMTVYFHFLKQQISLDERWTKYLEAFKGNMSYSNCCMYVPVYAFLIIYLFYQTVVTLKKCVFVGHIHSLLIDYKRRYE